MRLTVAAVPAEHVNVGYAMAVPIVAAAIRDRGAVTVIAEGETTAWVFARQDDAITAHVHNPSLFDSAPTPGWVAQLASSAGRVLTITQHHIRTHERNPT